MKEILLTEKRDGIPCVIIFPWYPENFLFQLFVILQ